jgi:hypothetical protein
MQSLVLPEHPRIAKSSTIGKRRRDGQAWRPPGRDHPNWRALAAVASLRLHTRAVRTLAEATPRIVEGAGHVTRFCALLTLGPMTPDSSAPAKALPPTHLPILSPVNELTPCRASRVGSASDNRRCDHEGRRWGGPGRVDDAAPDRSKAAAVGTGRSHRVRHSLWDATGNMEGDGATARRWWHPGSACLGSSEAAVVAAACAGVLPPLMSATRITPLRTIAWPGWGWQLSVLTVSRILAC